MKNNKITTILLSLFFGFLLSACGPKEETLDGSYQTKGVIQKIDTPRLTIAHEDIPGYMPAMTMVFEVENEEQAAPLAVGDTVDFTFLPTDGKFIVKKIEKGHASTAKGQSHADGDHHH